MALLHSIKSSELNISAFPSENLNNQFVNMQKDVEGEYLKKQFFGTVGKVAACALSVISGIKLISIGADFLSYTNFATINIATAFFPISLIPIGLFLVTLGLCFFKEDYEDPTLLQRFRIAAAEAPLEETLARHGENVFSRELLSPNQFNAKYNELADRIFEKEGIFGVINFYDSVKAMQKKAKAEDFCDLPSPDLFRKRWKDNSERLSFVDLVYILENNNKTAFHRSISRGDIKSFEKNIDSLIEHGILSKGHYVDCLKDFGGKLLALQKQRADKIIDANYIYKAGTSISERTAEIDKWYAEEVKKIEKKCQEAVAKGSWL